MQTLIIATVVVGFCMISCSRELPERNVPSLVQNAFRTKFVDARDIDWQKSNHHYLVAFESGVSEVEHKALFDSIGTMVMYKFEIPMNQLPSAVASVVHSEYQGYDIDEVENLEREGVTYYQVELEKGMKDRHLVFSADGVLQHNVAYWN